MKTALKITNPIRKSKTMKPRLMNYLTFAFAAMVTVTGCKKNGDGGNTIGDFNKSGSAYTDGRSVPLPTSVLPNVIGASRTLDRDTLYFLNGPTYVTGSSTTLTIESGTFIKGRKTSTSGHPSYLLVAKNSKLVANGTQELPIVFTSDQPRCSRAAGDWAGVVLLGNGKTNVATTTEIEGIQQNYVTDFLPSSWPGIIQYGGSDEADLAGQSSLKYIRIEFAGDELTTDKELNGLTLGAVGSSTTLNNIQVSWGADDAFEFFGGSVNGKYLISYGNNDDDFDFDQGYQGSIQFALAIKLACATGYSTNPNGIECNNVTSPVVTVNTRKTHPVLSNFTISGHSANPGPIGSGSAGIGVLFRADTEFTFVNSLVGGFGIGANYSTSNSPTAPVALPSILSNSVIHGFTATPVTPAGSPGTSVLLSTVANTLTNDFLKLSNPFNLSCVCPNSTAIPDFRYKTTPPPASPAQSRASFTGITVAHAGGALSAFDTTVTYAGAMGVTTGSRWDLGTSWTSYNPQGNTY